MIKRKEAIISSVILLVICMFLFFPFPNNVMLEGYSTFMSFPIHNKVGFNILGIIGSVLFVIAMILLAKGLKKHHFRTIVIVAIVYTILPSYLITVYQETLASGIHAISYDGNGSCSFDYVSKDLMNGRCHLVLHNRGNEAATVELEFIDSVYLEGQERRESLMNLAGPYRITIKANHKKAIYLQEILDLTDVLNHIQGGSSDNVHIKLLDKENDRIL
ncbi:hypothetical protein SAMN05216389_101144 [Oceanobacillus limi]|uniref:Uncharacterized protein n=1 Tax=Oceanobacillus limi TaxID=930131 RepID=A0A1H9Y295_9BACI|nr:hypothetical protein [Oceanobacillus limi]SES62927.1 hypothetical protein SAMN05216389_101144 [Oceanobacillus limi]